MVYYVALFMKIQYKHKADSLQAACLVFVLYDQFIYYSRNQPKICLYLAS